MGLEGGGGRYSGIQNERTVTLVKPPRESNWKYSDTSSFSSPTIFSLQSLQMARFNSFFATYPAMVNATSSLSGEMDSSKMPVSCSLVHVHIGVFFMKIFFPKIHIPFQKGEISQYSLRSYYLAQRDQKSPATHLPILGKSFFKGVTLNATSQNEIISISFIKNDCELWVVIRALDACFERKKIRNFGPWLKSICKTVIKLNFPITINVTVTQFVGWKALIWICNSPPAQY